MREMPQWNACFSACKHSRFSFRLEAAYHPFHRLCLRFLKVFLYPRQRYRFSRRSCLPPHSFCLLWLTGPPAAICFLKMGITLPLLSSTLPNRTIEKIVALLFALDCTSISAIRFVIPITLIGFTALSVEMNTNRCTSALIALSTTFSVPNMLFLTIEAEARHKSNKKQTSSFRGAAGCRWWIRPASFF